MKKNNYFLLTIIITLALCCVMLAGCSQNETPSGTTEDTNLELTKTGNSGVLLLKVNPEIAISYDEAGLVTDVEGRNSEGKAIVEGYSDYEGKECRTVISELVVAMADAGYFVESADSQRRTITIELEAGSGIPDDSFLDNIVTEVESKVAENHLNGTVHLDSPAQNESAATPTPDAGNDTNTADIGIEEAKRIALNHAGVAATAVTFAKTEKDYDDGHWLYEVEFYSENKEYDYEIDALTGSILDYDYDAENYAKPMADAGNDTNTADIGVEEAKRIALNHAGVAATEVTFAKTEKDYDDGRSVYEIEFYSENKEYDYEIDASTGSILNYDYEAENYDRPPAEEGSSTNYIGLEEAKTIALNHAGLSAGDVSFSKAKFEDDDGRKEYEIEFYYNNIEYEYSIDASSGNILEYDSEIDD